ncbi:hypothetical protein ABTX86_10265 [Streptomyces anulatus]|uniref:hypothetical protein n=1 Tax=Streptomyces anulatus TaxID=1892 RepID=UPI0033336E70
MGNDGPVQAGPEVGVGRPLHVRGVVGGEGVGRGVDAFREQAERAGAGECGFAGQIAADVEVLVPADVYGERIPCLQAAPGAVVAEHGPDEFQPDGDRHRSAVVEPGRTGREQVGQAVAVDRRLQAEAGEVSDLWLADLHLVSACVLGEGGDCRQVGILDRPVVTGRVLGTGVATALVTVGGVVLGDPVDERRHAAPRVV